MKVVKSKSGQNTAEYLVMLILIAVGSIGVFTAFGATLKTHVNNAVVAFTGNAGGTNALGDLSAENQAGKDATANGHGMNVSDAQVKRFGGAATSGSGGTTR